MTSFVHQSWVTITDIYMYNTRPSRVIFCVLWYISEAADILRAQSCDETLVIQQSVTCWQSLILPCLAGIRSFSRSFRGECYFSRTPQAAPPMSTPMYTAYQFRRFVMLLEFDSILIIPRGGSEAQEQAQQLLECSPSGRRAGCLTVPAARLCCGSDPPADRSASAWQRALPWIALSSLSGTHATGAGWQLWWLGSTGAPSQEPRRNLLRSQ